MVYVHVPQQSRRSRELADALRATIASYQAGEPKLTTDEIRAAVAAVTPGATSRAKNVAIVAAVVGGVAAMGTLGTVLESSKQGRAIPWTPITIAIAVALVGAAIVFAWTRNRE